mmetsp:Transcript_36731/g.92829  ORF Transcript_36731/g.92829 Transcript_36731/m.92829 type:complete len:189 (-) Transcript_36731:109-675(-)
MAAKPGFWRLLRQDVPYFTSVATNIVQFYCAVHCISEYLVDLSICVGPSMMPTLEKDGSLVVTEQVSPRLGKLGLGDVVIATSPVDVRFTVCKRVTGMPGDRIVQAPDGPGLPGKETIVPPGHIWLQGDNADNSRDSRLYGPVPQALVRGRVVYQLWPPSQVGFVASSVPAPAPPRWGGKWFGPGSDA